MTKKENTKQTDTGKRTYETAYKTHKDKDLLQQVSVEFYQWEEEGQILIGRLLEFEEVMSKEFEKPYNRYIIDTDDGLQGVICGYVMDSLVANKDLIGKIIAIEYLGQKQLAGDRVVNRFKINVIKE